MSGPQYTPSCFVDFLDIAPSGEGLAEKSNYLAAILGFDDGKTAMGLIRAHGRLAP